MLAIECYIVRGHLVVHHLQDSRDVLAHRFQVALHLGNFT